MRKQIKNLITAVGQFIQCRGICSECPLNKAVNENSEHPTFCEQLTEVNEKYTLS